MPWSNAAILAESAAWHWVPPGAEEVRTGRIQLSVRGTTATVLSATPASGDSSEPDHGAAELVSEVSELASRFGAERLSWRVGPGDLPPGLPGALRAAGAELERREDVCALDLSTGVPEIPVPDQVRARRPRSAGDLHAYRTVGAEVWGGEPPSEQTTAADFSTRDDSGPGGEFVAFLDGRPAGSAGYTLAGEVARLWGAGVRPALRGNGVYRALVAARLTDAVAYGTTLALVHAVVDTSAPILRRLGFSVYGQNLVFTLRFTPPWVDRR